MDITLLRTFLAVSATGSFADASQRLFVTQSAVSLRIRRLEDSLGHALFTRSKAGATLTNEGRAFESYATSIMRIWEEARHQIAVPEGFRTTMSIGAQYSLWQRMGFRILDEMRAAAPDVGLRAEMGMPDRLTRMLVEGVVHCAIMFTPILRPGLAVRKLAEDKLVLAASWPDPTLDLEGRYVFVDWGPEFIHAHAQSLPHLTNPGLTMTTGVLTADFISRRHFAAYLPARNLAPYLESGQLHLVPGAPTFPNPTWLVWRESISSELLDLMHGSVDAALARLESETTVVLDKLTVLNHGEFPGTLGGSKSHD
ncbi:MAG: LysR family transcriptional regulator [Rhodobacter sp.]|nr:LysR family transcriptional regulator [Rhodobacter sp.]